MQNRNSTRRSKRRGIENIFEGITSGNFSSLKERDVKIEEAQTATKKLNLNRTTSRHIIINMAKLKIKRGF